MTKTTIASLSDVIQFRKLLHKHPELSGEEGNTAQLISTYIKDLAPDALLTKIGGHGVGAIYQSGNPGPCIMVRCELDALPIQETNTFAHRSVVTGKSHKCGHDGHMAIVAGLAARLAASPLPKGKVVLFFQPAEENGEGAQAVMNDTAFHPLAPDFVLALHNLPGYPKKSVVVKQGTFTAAVKSVVIRLTGKTSHAAEPEKGINPALAIAEILQKTDNITVKDPSRADFALVTPIQVAMGEEAFGISAGYAEVKLTIRAWTNQGLDALSEKVILAAKNAASGHGLGISFAWLQEFRANENHALVVNAIAKAAKENNLDVVTREYPLKWGEDFGLFTEKYTGAMFGLGAGVNSPALHNPDYDFPDDIIDAGIQMFHSIILDLINK